MEGGSVWQQYASNCKATIIEYAKIFIRSHLASDMSERTNHNGILPMIIYRKQSVQFVGLFWGSSYVKPTIQWTIFHFSNFQVFSFYTRGMRSFALVTLSKMLVLWNCHHTIFGDTVLFRWVLSSKESRN